MWYLIVSIHDLCTLTNLDCKLDELAKLMLNSMRLISCTVSSMSLLSKTVSWLRMKSMSWSSCTVSLMRWIS